jgi:hypothetical protein
MGLTKQPKPMNINDLLAKLARGQQALRDPAVWQKHGEDLFPDTAFTVAVHKGQVKITGLNPEQQRLLQQDIATLLGL